MKIEIVHQVANSLDGHPPSCKSDVASGLKEMKMEENDIQLNSTCCTG